MVPWKLLVGPALLLGLKLAKIPYDDPSNLLIIRAAYGISQGLLFALCAYIYLAISQRGDEEKSVNVFTNTAATTPNEESKESTLTYKEYDLSELIKLTKNFALGAAVTIGIHYYMAVVPALVLQIVTQPITLFEHPLFTIYVLDKDASKDENLKRPFADNSPAARLEAMKTASLKQQQEQLQSLPAEAREVEDTAAKGETGNIGTGGDVQTSLSMAEKRPTRHSNALSGE